MSNRIPEHNSELDSANPSQPVSENNNQPTPATPKVNEDDDPRPAHKILHNGTLVGIGMFHGFLFVFWVLPASSYAAYKAADLIINGPFHLRPPQEDSLFIPSAAAFINFFMVLTLLPNYRWIAARKK